MTARVRRSSGRTNFHTLDLFSGCGGLTEGFISAGHASARFVPVGAVELDPFAAATYAANFGPHVFQGDISDWVGSGLPVADVVVGGPPCQGFSALGKRDPDDPRNKLWTHYVEVVADVKPLYFVLENVAPFLASDQYGQLAAETLRGGKLEDYTLDGGIHTVIASAFGAAQKRRRAVVIGRRKDIPVVDLDSARLPARTVHDAIGHTTHRVDTQSLPARRSSVVVANRTIDTPGIYLTPELHVTRHFTPLSEKRFRAIPEGGNRHNLPPELLAPCWKNHPGGSHDVMGRLHWDRPSVTIRTEFWKPEKGRYLHPVAHRPITHMEAALLQGFPPEFRWCGSKVSIGRQIGNAVPVQLGRAIAQSLLDQLVATGVSPRR